MVGAKLVFPGPFLDPETLLDDFEQEGVTITAGVPTIWMGILGMLDAEPERWNLEQLQSMLVGGSAAPRAMIAGFRQRHGKTVVHGWGMTETSPLATTSDYVGEFRDADEETQLDVVAMQGLPLPFVELRAMDDEGKEIPWDGEAMGELEVRGPWVAAGYYETPEQAERWTDDGWFKTGDIVTFHPLGYVMIKDRSKDVIKSGGEWISSVDLENALMAHPAIAEAAVIAIPHEKWDERPLAVCVLREGQTATPDELREFLAPNFAKCWLPDAFEFVDEIPKTAVGKFRKTALREQFAKRAGPPSADPGEDLHRHGWPLRARRGDRGDARARGREGRDRRPARDGRHRRGGGARRSSSRATSCTAPSTAPGSAAAPAWSGFRSTASGRSSR